MVAEGAIITVLGMSVVFLFLGLLVLIMRLISGFAGKILKPEPAALPARVPETGSEAEIALACAAAFVKAASDKNNF